MTDYSGDSGARGCGKISDVRSTASEQEKVSTGGRDQLGCRSADARKVGLESEAKSRGSSSDMTGGQSLASLRHCVCGGRRRSLCRDTVDGSMGDGSLGKVFPKHA